MAAAHAAGGRRRFPEALFGARTARMRALCPSRRHRPVVGWLADANVLRATRTDYARWDGSIGRGRTRLYFVNLPLVAWLAGVGKGRLSWAARSASTCPHVAPGGSGEAHDAT